MESHWEKLAFAFRDCKNLKKADYCIHLQSTLRPDSAAPFLNLGSFYLCQGMYQEALLAYKKGLKIDPNDACINYNMALIYCFEQRDTLAHKHLNTAILSNPDLTLTYIL